MWWNSVIQRLTHYYSNRLHQPHCAVLPCSTLFLPSHSPKRPLLLVTTDFRYFIGLCSEAKKCLYFIMGDLPRLTSKNFIDEHFSGLSCYILSATMANVDEHFWIFHKPSTNTYFLRLEVSRGKYPIIRYREFLAALHKSFKWELFVVPYNNGCLAMYEGKNTFTVVGQWTLFCCWLLIKAMVHKHFSFNSKLSKNAFFVKKNIYNCFSKIDKHLFMTLKL